jgi:hypothetical protein
MLDDSCVYVMLTENIDDLKANKRTHCCKGNCLATLADVHPSGFSSNKKLRKMKLLIFYITQLFHVCDYVYNGLIFGIYL